MAKLFCSRPLFFARAMTKQLHASLSQIPPPPHVHVSVDIPSEKRVVVVGDVHGCVQELRALLDKANFSETQDVLVFVGDLVNKGPDSPGVIALARQLGALSVVGNHDRAAVGTAISRRRSTIPPNGDDGRWTDELSSEDIAWLTSLPYTIRLPPRLWPGQAKVNSVVVVHAGVVPGVPLSRQNMSDMIVMRNLVARPAESKVAQGVTYAWEATSKPTVGIPWAQHYGGPDAVIFGHDARRGIQQTDYVLGLDSGCCYGQTLTAVVLPVGELVSVPAASTPKVFD